MTDSIYDLAVIGAGVMGLSAAFIAASSRPGDRIVIFDRETVGAGASGFAPGIQINIGRNEREEASSIVVQRFGKRSILMGGPAVEIATYCG
ncbi:FAD-dependent oxidoreductase [Bradyrhizobium sp. 13971]